MMCRIRNVMTTAIELAERLEAARLAPRRTRQQLMGQSGVSRNAVYRLLKGNDAQVSTLLAVMAVWQPNLVTVPRALHRGFSDVGTVAAGVVRHLAHAMSAVLQRLASLKTSRPSTSRCWPSSCTASASAACSSTSSPVCQRSCVSRLTRHTLDQIGIKPRCFPSRCGHKTRRSSSRCGSTSPCPNLTPCGAASATISGLASFKICSRKAWSGALWPMRHALTRWITWT